MEIIITCREYNEYLLKGSGTKLLWLIKKQIPFISEGTKKVQFGDCNLTYLPPLPDSLEELHCSNNWLISLPTLPDNLKSLWCIGNYLTYFPKGCDKLHEFVWQYQRLRDFYYGTNKLPLIRKLQRRIRKKYRNKRKKDLNFLNLPEDILSLILEY